MGKSKCVEMCYILANRWNLYNQFLWNLISVVWTGVASKHKTIQNELCKLHLKASN